MTDFITRLEELSINAWAPLQNMVYDGWVIRMANGYTKRANAVHPLYASQEGLDEKIAFCETLFSRYGLPAIFKLTSASQPPELDDVLKERGYDFEPEVSVQTFALPQFDGVIAPEVRIEPEPSAQWLAAFQRMQGLSDEKKTTLTKMLANILPERAFASIALDGHVIACGLGVEQSGFVGLYDIATDEHFRRRGYGRMIVESLLAWGKQRSAQSAYLQVMIDNDPALNLYEKIGFQEVYRYWYRIKHISKTGSD